jgi:hypothetical protein
MNEKDNYILLQTKVKKSEAEILDRIAQNRGTTIYGLLQLMCQFLIRTASGQFNLSEEINHLLTLFHLEPGWKDSFCSCDPTAEMEVAQEILILQQQGKKGFGAVMVNKPFMGAWTQTECVDDIIERVIEVCAPGIYNRLRTMCAIREITSVLDLLVTLTDAQVLIDLDEANRREIQQANNIAPNGKAVEYGAKRRSKKHFTPDTMPKRIIFKDIDHDAPAPETEEWEGLHHDS